MNNEEMYHSDILNEILDDVTPMEQQKVEKRMLLAAKIADAMQAKGWKKKDLMEATGQKNQSVITKWLSGTHNFTTDTLFELEAALGLELIDLSNRKEESTMATFHCRVETRVKVPKVESDLNTLIRRSTKQGLAETRVTSSHSFSTSFAEA